MTEATTDPTEKPSSGGDRAPGSSGSGSDGSDVGLSRTNLIKNLQWGGLLVLVVAALVAAVTFYTSATRAIRVWVGPGFQPLFVAAFNLAVLAFSVAGISLLARRLQTGSAGN